MYTNMILIYFAPRVVRLVTIKYLNFIIWAVVIGKTEFVFLHSSCYQQATLVANGYKHAVYIDVGITSHAQLGHFF